MSTAGASAAQLAPGAFVYAVTNDLGVAKLLTHGAICELEYFTAFAAEERLTMKIRRGDVRVAPIARGTRCYWSKKGHWRTGQVVVVGQRRSVVTAQGLEVPLPVADLFVGSALPIEPLELIRAQIVGSYDAYSLRHRWRRAAIDQRTAARGLDGVASSSVNLHAHQLEVARRVLLDPIQRYLLGDEVGLGKTIEAGLVIRQLLVSHPGARVVVLVPSPLVGQWEAEIAGKFHPAQFSDADVLVRPYNPRQAWQDEGDVDLLVVDEAHRITSDPTSPLFSAVGALAKRTPRLLMLSATPSLTNQRAYLGLLHLLDPDVYQIDDIAGFRQRLELRAELAQMMLTFKPSLPNFHLRRVVRRLVEQFPNDQRLAKLTEDLAGILDNAAGNHADIADREHAINAVRTHVEETYRLHRRLLRTRRSSANEDGVVIRGRTLPAEQEIAPQEAILEVNDLLDAWRETIAESARQAAAVNIAAQVAPMFFARGGSDLELLAGIVKLRLGRARDGRAVAIPRATMKSIAELPFADAERGVLEELLVLLEQMPESVMLARATAVRDVIERSAADKVVVFTGFDATATRVTHLLHTSLGDQMVADLTPSASPQAATEIIERFRSDPSRQVLVAPPIANEGFNLQFADQVIHADLPWMPNVVEQRIGRLDRYGADTPFATTVILDGDANSYCDAWYRCLRDGFGVFERSVAGLQMLIPSVMRAIRETLLLEGLDGLEQKTKQLPAELARELDAIEERESLDSIEAAGTTRDYLKGLMSADEQADELEIALSRSASLGQAEFRATHSRHRFRLTFGTPHESDSDLTVDRNVAVRDPRAELFRPGHPSFERFDRVLAGLESARTYAVRIGRTDAIGDTDLFWCVDLVVAPRAPSTMTPERDYRFWHDTVSARARWYLPPRLLTVVLDAGLEPLANQGGLIDAASSADRIEFAEDDWPLGNFMHEHDWASQCSAAAAAARDHILQTPAVRARIDAAAKDAARDSTEAEHQADAREAALVLGAIDGLPEELELRRAVIEAIELATATVDAIGVITAAVPE